MISEKPFHLACFGPSMWPSIRHMDRISTESIDTSEVRNGDVVVYCGDRVMVCHRVIFKQKFDGIQWYFLKGDGKIEADGWIPEYRIMGRVSRVNARSLNQIQSKLLYWHSKLQWMVYETFSLSPIGVWVSKRWRQRGWPSLAEAFHRISAPWSFWAQRAPA